MQDVIQINGVDTPDTLFIDSSEIIYKLQEVRVQDQLIVALVTNKRISLMTYTLQSIIAEYSAEEHHHLAITNVSIEKEQVLVSLQGGLLLYFNLATAGDDLASMKLIPTRVHQCEHDVSALALSEQSRYACVALFNAPLYSLIIINTQTMREIAKRSAANFADEDMLNKFCKNLEIKGSQSTSSQENPNNNNGGSD